MTEEEKWKAVSENDESMDGIFFYCVKSTGIFCRPSCKSKLPKRDNVIFVNTKEAAMRAGFRPCKRCRSDLVMYRPLQEAASELKDITDKYWRSTFRLQQEIRTLGFSDHRLTEIFREAYGMTPAEYIAEKKLKYAKDMLKISDTRIIDIALDLNFSAMSSFYKFFKGRTGMTPGEYRRGLAER